MHIWEFASPLDPKLIVWSCHKHDGAEEYTILEETADASYNFVVQNVRTGEKFDMYLSEDNRTKS